MRADGTAQHRVINGHTGLHWLHEDEIRSVEGPDVGKGGPEGTAPLAVNRFFRVALYWLLLSVSTGLIISTPFPVAVTVCTESAASNSIVSVAPVPFTSKPAVGILIPV